MRHIRLIVPVLLAAALFSTSAMAQKKPAPKKTPAKKPAAKPITVVPPLDVRAAREKIDVQLDNLNRFIDVLGPIAIELDKQEAEARKKPLSAAAAEKHAANRQKVVDAIRNFRTPLTALELEFRTKPDLQKYQTSIEGIAELVMNSEDTAIAGRFGAARTPLREISMKLLDTLAVLPK